MYVADAHALGWYFTDNPRLGQQATRVFECSERGECTILVPTVVLAELFHISRKKRLALDFSELLRKVEERGNFVVTELDLPVLSTIHFEGSGQPSAVSTVNKVKNDPAADLDLNRR